LARLLEDTLLDIQDFIQMLGSDNQQLFKTIVTALQESSLRTNHFLNQKGR
jgi:hypothetical protein